jgi:ABC-type transport system involved in multi-copper enzyme maturation permease subunit/ABC-type uncharacterized transport system involved in gliding motility auxiliary subunit
MRNTLVVAWKEFRTFFQTPIGYVILFVFTGLAGWFFFNVGNFFQQREPSIRALLTWLPWLFLIFAPAITMRLWAEEKRAGTIETLLTLPLTDWQLVLGKFLAAFGLVAAWLVCLAPIVGVVAWFGDPDKGPILGGFVSALLLGGAFAAIGLAASALTENQIISLIVGVIVSFFFLLVGFDPVVAMFPSKFGGFLYNLSLSTHFHSIARGVLDTRDLLFYVSFIVFFLIINVWAVRRQKGRAIQIPIVAAILLLVNYLGAGFFTRLDLTENQRYTLASDTKRVLGKLDDDLRLTAYLTSAVPAELSNIRRDIEDLVREFQSYAGGHLKVEIADPGKNEEAAKAAEAAGIPKIPFQVASESKFEVGEGYLGIVIEYGGKTEKLPAVTGVTTLEYDLVRRIAKMTRREAVKVGWQVNDPFGGMNIPGMDRPPSSDRHSPTSDMRQMDTLLKEEYETTTVDLKSKVPDEVKAVIVCNTDALTDVQKFNLDQFLMRGGGVIVMADGTEPMSFGGMPGRGGGSPFMRTASEKVPEDFFSHYGFKIDKNMVLDAACLPVPVRTEMGSVIKLYPPLVAAIGEFIDQNHPISARFKELAFLWTSSVELDPKPGVKKFELVKSTDHAKKLDGFIDVSFQQLMNRNSATFDPDTFKEQFVLAGMLEGDFQSYFLAHEVPKEVIEGKPPAEQAPMPGGHPDFSDLVEPIPPHDGAGGGAEDGDHDEASDGKKSGGPRLDPQQEPAPANPPKQDAPPPAPAPAPSPAAHDANQATGETKPAGNDAKPAEPARPAEPKKDFEYLKQSSKPGKIFVFGTSSFVDEQSVQIQPHNALFLQSIVDYMSSESLSTLRAKRIDEGMFDEPSSAAKNTAIALGWIAPAALIGLLGVVVVLVWRRTIRPARTRRRIAAGGAN